MLLCPLLLKMWMLLKLQVFILTKGRISSRILKYGCSEHRYCEVYDALLQSDHYDVCDEWLILNILDEMRALWLVQPPQQPPPANPNPNPNPQQYTQVPHSPSHSHSHSHSHWFYTQVATAPTGRYPIVQNVQPVQQMMYQPYYNQYPSRVVFMAPPQSFVYAQVLYILVL